jgi:hypothetical protein
MRAELVTTLAALSRLTPRSCLATEWPVVYSSGLAILCLISFLRRGQ